MKRQFMMLLAAILMLLPASAPAEETAEAEVPQLVDMGFDLGTVSIHWPQLNGLEDEAIQARVNEALTDAANAPALSARMALVMNADPPLIANWRGEIRNHILSCVLYAEGPIETERFQSVYHCVNIDLKTGEAFALADLFEDPDTVTEGIESWLTDTIAPDLSAHLMNSDLLPIPEDFLLEDTGLTLFYPKKQLSTLTDRAGAITLEWHPELVESLKVDEDSIPVRFGLKALHDYDREAFFRCFENGSVPGIPARIGDSVEKLVSAYHLDGEPDFYDGGRYVELEDSRFRGAWLMTDNLSAKVKQFPDSVVQGIRTDRFSLYGVATDSEDCTRDEILREYGDPYASVELKDEAAEAMRLVAGISDYYHAGDYRLRLHYDEEGYLRSIFLLP